MAELVFLSRSPSPALSGLVARVSGYASPEEPSYFLETAELVFPLVFNFGRPWDIRLGHDGSTLRTTSFTAGLFPGAVHVSCDSGAELVQVDLTPLGAVRLFGGAAADLASQVVDLGAIDGFARDYASICDRLRSCSTWQSRVDLVERFLIPRFTNAASGEVGLAWSMLANGHSVAETAGAIGWSARHFSTRFRQETGIRPVTASRMLRFHRARALALKPDTKSWAGIAADAGYSDQAHLIREFKDLAGTTPTAWARSERPSEPRLHI